MRLRRDLVLLKYLIISGTVCIALAASSCATKKDIREFRQEMQVRNDNTESRLVSLEQYIVEIDSLVRDQNRLSQSLRALFGSQSQEQRDNIDLISARQDEINYQLRELLQRLQAIQLYGGVDTKPTAPSQDSSGSKPANEQQASSPATNISSQIGGEKVDPEQVYNTALDDIKNERFQLAESRFLSFLIQFPEHELADNAQYWLGESVYAQGKYDLAITEFEKVSEKYKKSPKIPSAMLKIGYAYYELGQNKNGTAMLNKLIKSYPKSDEAKLARARLK